MDVLHLYRPALPEVRAQVVQVVHTCHALAERGHRVTLLADRAGEGDAEALLAAYGLSRPSTFDLRVAPTRWRPGAGLWFRAQVAAWARNSAAPRVVYAREKKYVSLLPGDVPVVIEAHEAEVPIAAERGEDVEAARTAEAAVMARAAALVTNCGGTLAALEESCPRLPALRRVIHNATRGDRVVVRTPAPEVLVGYTGSPKVYKGLATVFASLPGWPEGAVLEMVGGGVDGAPEGVRVCPAVPYGALPARLARYHALLLPLDDNLFGRRLTSPLKLWDYLATGIPIVAADLPTTREIGGDRLHYYQPGDASDLARALRAALTAGAAEPLIRTWAARAADVEALLVEALAAADRGGRR